MLEFIIVIAILYFVIKMFSYNDNDYSSGNNTYSNSNNKLSDNLNIFKDNSTINNFTLQNYEIMMEDEYTITDYNGKVYYKNINNCDSEYSTIYITDDCGDIYTIYNHSCNNSNYYDCDDTNYNLSSWYDDEEEDDNDNNYWENSYISNSWYSYNEDDDDSNEWYKSNLNNIMYIFVFTLFIYDYLDE